MGACNAALVEHGDRRLSQPLGSLRVGLEQLRQAKRAGQPCGPGAHEQHADVDALLLAGLRCRDELADVDGWAVVRRAASHRG
jgi:hypothetical protein